MSFPTEICSSELLKVPEICSSELLNFLYLTSNSLLNVASSFFSSSYSFFFFFSLRILPNIKAKKNYRLSSCIPKLAEQLSSFAIINSA